MPATYYAVAAKVRALYGRRFTGEDYRLLMSKTTIPEAAAFLQAHPGYRDQLAGYNTAQLHREGLENALRRAYVDEYRRIFSFMPTTDQELLRFPLYKAEHEAILAAMRQLTSTAPLSPTDTWLPLLEKESSLDLEVLRHTSTFAEIAKAGEHTIYGSALARIAAGEIETPTHAFVDNMMQVVYFATLYKTMNQRYSGQTKQVIRQSLDEVTDLMNLVQFLRLKKFFSEEDIRRYSFPLPCSRKLPKEYMQQLMAAPDYDTAFSLVLDGTYGKLFHSIPSSGLEAYLYPLQFNFSRRQLRAANPTVYTPIAYLTLKEIELRNVISIVECIYYEGDPNAFVTLIGV